MKENTEVHRELLIQGGSTLLFGRWKSSSQKNDSWFPQAMNSLEEN